MTMKKRTKKTTLAKKPATTPQPKAAPVPAEIHHTFTLLATLNRYQMEKIGGKVGNPIAESSAKFVCDLMERFKARDPIEEMLFSQMVLTYGRMAYLTAYADQQSNIKWATMMHEAADRAANTFRRQMLALAEYRRPLRANSFTAIGQANIAQQQVVQNRISENETTNEQGSSGTPGTAKMLPPDGQGAASPAGSRAPGAAVAGEHGTEDGGREGAGERERPQAR